MVSKGYSEPLARIHEEGFVAHAMRAANFLETILPAGARLHDLGCGGGTMIAYLREQGFDVSGLDLTPAMVDQAEDLDLDVEVGNLWEHDIPEADVITAVGEVFNYAFEEPQSLQGLFERIHEALTPGGFLVFDMAVPGRANPATKGKAHGSNWRMRFEAKEVGDTLERTLHIDGPGGHRVELHRLRLLPIKDIESALHGAGFTFERRDGYGGGQPWKGLYVWVARKAAS